MADLGLHCLNCGEEVAPDKGKLFVQVFVCPSCNSLLEQYRIRIQQELRAALAMLEDAIRTGLVQKKLRIAALPKEDLNKQEILGELGHLLDVTGKRWQKDRGTMTDSTVSTKPNVPPVVGKSN